jgi:hypothetical protein
LINVRKRQRARKRQLVRQYQQLRRRRREARKRELRMLREQSESYRRRLAQIVLEADADGDWQDAGYSSSEEWLAAVLSGTFINYGATGSQVEPALAPDQEAQPRH